MTQPLRLHRFPPTTYATAWHWQRRMTEAVAGGADEALALLQHPPVYTFGRRVRPEHLLVDAWTLLRRGAEVVESDRGGDVTFHGPGQLVGYPILDLRRRGLGPAEYVRLLEEALIRSVRAFGIRASRVHGRPGVWTDAGKLAAIGVCIRRGISTHGFALNVDNDLSWFEAIVPCGISNASVTSMQSLLGHSPGVEVVSDAVAAEFAVLFDCTLTQARDVAALDEVMSVGH